MIELFFSRFKTRGGGGLVPVFRGWLRPGTFPLPLPLIPSLCRRKRSGAEKTKTPQETKNPGMKETKVTKKPPRSDGKPGNDEKTVRVVMIDDD